MTLPIQPRCFDRALALTGLLVVLLLTGQAMAQQITVQPQGQFVYDSPIAPVAFSPGLKFLFTTEARAAKVRVELEVLAGPSGKEGVAFAFPETEQRWVEINSYQTDLALHVPDGALPGSYKGRLAFHAEPKEITITPSEVAFSFTIVEPTLTVTWSKDPGSNLRLGSVSTGGAGSFKGPQFTVAMDDVMASGSKLNFEATDNHLWIKGATGEPQKGIGALGPGTYTIVLDPNVPAGNYKGTLKFSMLAVGTKINGQSGALEYGYQLKVTNPLLTMLKVGGSILLLVLVGVALVVVKKQMGQQKKAGGKPQTVEGLLEFIVPMERRPEKLDRVAKQRIVFGEKGDLLKDVRRINFELAGYIRDGKKVVELTQLKGSCPIYVNGTNTFNTLLYDADLLKFGEYPTFEVRYRNPELAREGGQSFAPEEVHEKAREHEETRQPIGLAASSADDEGQLESLSGETRPMSQQVANRDMASAMSDALSAAKGGMDLDLDLSAPTTPSKSKSSDLDLSLDLDLDIEPPSDAGDGGKSDKKKTKDSNIDLPEGFDLLGDS